MVKSYPYVGSLLYGEEFCSNDHAESDQNFWNLIV